jgi:hypothetical protein
MRIGSSHVHGDKAMSRHHGHGLALMLAASGRIIGAADTVPYRVNAPDAALAA